MKHLGVEIRGKGGGGAVIQTLRSGGAVSKKKFFWPFRPQFGLKIMGARAPLPWIRHWFFLFKRGKYNRNTQRKTPLCKKGN